MNDQLLKEIKSKYIAGEIKSQNLETVVFTEVYGSDAARVADACDVAARIRCESIEEATGVSLEHILCPGSRLRDGRFPCQARQRRRRQVKNSRGRRILIIVKEAVINTIASNFPTNGRPMFKTFVPCCYIRVTNFYPASMNRRATGIRLNNSLVPQLRRTDPENTIVSFTIGAQSRDSKKYCSHKV